MFKSGERFVATGTPFSLLWQSEGAEIRYLDFVCEPVSRRLKQGKGEAAARLLEGIQVSAKRAASLTQRLLAFSRRQTLDLRPTDVNVLIDGLVDLINRSVGPAITVITHLEPDLGLSRIDPAQLESSLLNLAINSRDAMPEGRGAISITTQTIELDDLMAARADLPPGEYIAISVTDSGSGISPENIKRIFDPFFTTKPLGQGTGLGLSMVHGFVLQSGGQIDVHSQEGVGTTIRLLLPKFEGHLELLEGEARQSALSGQGSGEF